MAPVDSSVLVESRGLATWVALNRPERRNAYDIEMLERVIAAVAETPDDHFIVVTGTDGSFCAGGYLANLADPKPAELRTMFNGSLRLFDALRGHPMPVIAAVNGPAVGGGNELVVACDLAIAGRSAYFGQNGVRIGSAPVLGGTNLLAASIGEKRGKEVAFLCRRYPADEALAMGWINAVVDDDELERAVVRDDRRTGADEPPVPRDRQGLVERVVEPDARLLRDGPGHACPGDRLRGHARGRQGVHREAGARLPPATRGLRPVRRYRDLTPTFDDPADWTLPQILRERARTHGERSFLEVPFQDAAYSFSETLELAERIAANLVGDGLVHGDRLVIMASNCVEYVLAWFGSACAGIVEVPMNTAYKGSFLEHQVRTTAPRAVLAEPEFVAHFLDGNDAYATVEIIYVLGEGAETEAALAAVSAPDCARFRSRG